MSKLEEIKKALSTEEEALVAQATPENKGKQILLIKIRRKGLDDGFDAAIALDLPVKFAKWLKNLDNGTEHYNPYTGEKSDSIGFSPCDCYEDDVMTVEELYQYWIENIFKIE